MGKLKKYVAPPGNENKRALRDGFGEGLLYLGEHNPAVVALCADLSDSDRMIPFRDRWPDRFVEVGIQEQNMIGVAAGMALAGKIPFAGSFAVFSPGRNWDQVRVSACYSRHNVKLYGGHAGITVGEDGATHQALEDIAITRVLPGMTVIVPCDATEMRKATIAAAGIHGPVYLRGGRPKKPQTTIDDTPFSIGKALPMRTGKDATIIACGIMVHEALLAAEALAEEKIDAAVLNMHTIKPIDETAIILAAHETGCLVTAEEHQVIGGLGSAVAEVLARHYPVPLERVGVNDTFGESGTSDALQDKYGLRAKDIIDATRRVIARRKRGPHQEFAPATKDVRALTRKKTGKKDRAKAQRKVPGRKASRKKPAKKKSSGKGKESRAKSGKGKRKR